MKKVNIDDFLRSLLHHVEVTIVHLAKSYLRAGLTMQCFNKNKSKTWRDWRSGTHNKVLVYQVQSPEFKTQYCLKRRSNLTVVQGL